jgi:hypothetical protein
MPTGKNYADGHFSGTSTSGMDAYGRRKTVGIPGAMPKDDIYIARLSAYQALCQWQHLVLLSRRQS